jgi:hypothetical protein
MRGRSGACGVLVGKTEGKEPLGRPRYRWEDNIKTDMQQVGREEAWTALIRLRYGQVAGCVAKAVMNFRVP